MGHACIVLDRVFCLASARAGANSVAGAGAVGNADGGTDAAHKIVCVPLLVDVDSLGLGNISQHKPTGSFDYLASAEV